MVLVIDLSATRPPEGTVVAGDGAAMPFVGWLGLISALSRALDRPAGDEGPADTAAEVRMPGGSPGASGSGPDRS